VLRIGDRAPDFHGLGTDGGLVRLDQFTGRPLILYFFHKAFTPNCTIETRGFRNNHPELKELGFGLVGVSTDSLEQQCAFASSLDVSYPMVSDFDCCISRAYGVLWPLIPFARRVAYVLDRSHAVTAVFRHEFQASKHLDEVLRFARSWSETQQPARAAPGARTRVGA
jgi:thioredoxin-dependent peroxiredoxin